MSGENQFYEQKLGISYWFVTHKLLLKNILKVILVVINLLVFSYLTYVLVFNFGIDQENYKNIEKNLTIISNDYESSRSVSLPTDIQIGTVKNYRNNENYDIVAEIINPNDKWWARFDYQFQLLNSQTEKRTGFIMPAQKKTVLDLNVKDGNQVANVLITNIEWIKEVNYESLRNERFLLETKNIEYITSKDLGLEDEIAISRVVFDLQNNSAFSYDNVNVLIFLKSGSDTVAVNQVGSGFVASQQTKKIELTFFQKLPKITSLELVAELNYLDEDNIVI